MENTKESNSKRENISLEKRLNQLIDKAKKDWRTNALGGKVKDCIIQGSNYSKIYCGSKYEISFFEQIPRINAGEYIIFDNDGSCTIYGPKKSMSPEKIRVYSPNLEYQFTYEKEERERGWGGEYHGPDD